MPKSVVALVFLVKTVFEEQTLLQKEEEPPKWDLFKGVQITLPKGRDKKIEPSKKKQKLATKKIFEATPDTETEKSERNQRQ